MEDALARFAKRQAALRRKHTRLARGYVTRLDRNGTFVQVPDSKSRGIALRGLLWSGVVFMAFKVFLLTGLGPEAYQSHLYTLEQGSAFERAGRWLMQIDPVTASLAQLISRLGF
jgi:hypothetical protein